MRLSLTVTEDRYPMSAYPGQRAEPKEHTVAELSGDLPPQMLADTLRAIADSIEPERIQLTEDVGR